MGACWLLDFVTGMPGSMVGSSVDNTLRSYKLWTLLTGSFYVDSLFFMVLIIYNFNSFLPKLVSSHLFRKNASLLPSSCSASSSTAHSSTSSLSPSNLYSATNKANLLSTASKAFGSACSSNTATLIPKAKSNFAASPGNSSGHYTPTSYCQYACFWSFQSRYQW